MPRAGQVVMFADEDCGFCMRTAAQVPRLGVDVDVRTLQAGDLSTLPIDADRALIEMPAIDADGTVHYGHRAWAAILRTGLCLAGPGNGHDPRTQRACRPHCLSLGQPEPHAPARRHPRVRATSDPERPPTPPVEREQIAGN